nr:hypothetical protein CFP56_11297 [Quercus suber]
MASHKPPLFRFLSNSDASSADALAIAISPCRAECCSEMVSYCSLNVEIHFLLCLIDFTIPPPESGAILTLSAFHIFTFPAAPHQTCSVSKHSSLCRPSSNDKTYLLDAYLGRALILLREVTTVNLLHYPSHLQRPHDTMSPYQAHGTTVVLVTVPRSWTKPAHLPAKDFASNTSMKSRKMLEVELKVATQRARLRTFSRAYGAARCVSLLEAGSLGCLVAFKSMGACFACGHGCMMTAYVFRCVTFESLIALVEHFAGYSLLEKEKYRRTGDHEISFRSGEE